MADTPVPNAPLSAAVEGIAPAAPVATPQAPAADPKLEAIIRREKMLYKRDRELKAREAAIAARESSFRPDEYVPKSKFQQDPLTTLQELGLGYDKLTELQLQQPNGNDPTIRLLMNKIAAMEEKLTSSANSQQQAQAQQTEQVMSQMLADAESFTADNPDYELIHKWGAHDMIVEEIKQEFERTQREMGRGIVINMDTAAKRVEDRLFNETLKALEFNKIKNYKKPVTPDSVIQTPEQIQQQQASAPKRGQIPYKVETIKTLTNTMTQDRPSSSKDSMEERKRRAIAAYNGTKV